MNMISGTASQQMSAANEMSKKRENERALFEAFLKIAPEFAGEPLREWCQPEDEREFPDIVGTSATGKRIGVEIGEWLNEEEIQAANCKERIRATFLDAIGDQGENPTKHIRYVWLRPSCGIKPADHSAFREQLMTCIRACDERWPNEYFWQAGHELAGDDLAEYPLLARYLETIKLWPADGEQWKTDWITFPARAGWFDSKTMGSPLKTLVAKKLAHYGSSQTGFDDLSLLIIYNLAARYNSPADTPLHTFDDAATQLRATVAENPGPFNRVFLYIAVRPGERVLQVYVRLHDGTS